VIRLKNTVEYQHFPFDFMEFADTVEQNLGGNNLIRNQWRELMNVINRVYKEETCAASTNN
jgi:hypothetical protein